MQLQLKRILFIYVILALICSFFVLPASAAVAFIDFDQYSIYSVSKTDGMWDVTASFPSEWTMSRVWSTSYAQQLLFSRGNSLEVLVPTSSFCLQVTPLGGQSLTGGIATGTQLYDSNIFDLSLVPDDTVFTFGFRVICDCSFDDQDITSQRLKVFNVNESGVITGGYTYQLSAGYESTDSGFVLTYTGQITPEMYDPTSAGLVFYYELVNLGISPGTSLRVEYDYFRLNFSVTDAIKQAQDDSRSQKMLSNIETALEDQGQTLDGILGALNQDSGGASGALKDQTSQQGDKLDQMAGVMDSVDRPDPGDINISMDQYISQDDFQTFSPFLQLLWDTPIFMKLLLMLLMVAAVSYVLFGKKG